jgi:hypothetical protein
MALELAAGTTAERPTSPEAGMLRFNTDVQLVEYYDGTAWLSLFPVSEYSVSDGQGTNGVYQPNFPAPGVNQSSEPFRVNFTTIGNAITNLQKSASTLDSVISVETLVSDQSGAVTVRLDWKEEGFVLPNYRPISPGDGALRYDPVTRRVEYYTSEWRQLVFEVDGALQLPTGDDSERPANPEPGMVRFSTESSNVEFFDGTDWLTTSQRTKNRIYVDKLGSDTNDGRTTNVPLRTIREACARARTYLNDGLFEPDRVTIFVSSGDYEETCPIIIPPGVSIIGDNLRSVTVRPTVATSDVFLLNSACYVNGLTVRGHRLFPSALEITPVGFAGHQPWTGPGAAPTLTSDQSGWAFRFAPGAIIRVSPYIQNVSSISGSGVYGTPDFIPGGGGVLCDPTDTGPGNKINSIVVDAFTQINLGGIGVKVANGGYMQLVSFFKNFCQFGVLCVSGGHATLLNSNCSFGNYALWSDGSRLLDPKDDFDDARELLLRNKDYLVAETVAYVNETFPAFVYDEVKCARDVGLILDSLKEDLINGNTLSALFAGNSYWIGTTSYIDGQTTETIAAVNYLLSQIGIILDNRFIKFAPQNEARVLLDVNRTFLQKELSTWVTQTYPSLTYDIDNFERDVGFIVDAIREDLLNGDDLRSIFAANAYWFGTISAIPGQASETIAAISRLEYLMNKVVGNEVITDKTSSEIQQIPTNGVGATIYNGVDARPQITSNLKLFRSIVRSGQILLDTGLVKGPAAVPALSRSITTITEIMADGGRAFAARAVIKNNRAFLAAQVTAFIDATYPGFNYNRTTCARDVGLILDSLALDLQTNDNAASIKAGNAYWIGSRSVIPGEAVETKAAMDFLVMQVGSLLQGLAVSVLQPIQPDTSGAPVADAALYLAEITQNVETIKAIIDAGSVNDFFEASALLELNRAFLQEEVIAWTDANFGALVYDRTKCRRDVGFMIDALQDDITAGNDDLNSIIAGNFYWSGITNVLDPGAQKTETIAALRHLQSLIVAVVRNQVVTGTYQNAQTQVIDLGLPLARAADAFVRQRLDLIIEIVETGGRNHQARIVLETNRIFFRKEIIAYISATYPGFVYDQATCERDVGLILDALILDIQRGDNRQSLKAGNAYWQGTTTVIPGEAVQTRAALIYLTNLIRTLLRLQTPITFQSLVLPVANPALTAAVNAETEIALNMAALTGIIASGPSDNSGTFGSLIEASGYTLSYAGAGIDFSKLSPSQGGAGVSDANKYTITRSGGEIFSTITDENGDFYVGVIQPGTPPSPNFRVSQRRGAIEGRAFYQSIFGFMAPFIMALTRR